MATDGPDPPPCDPDLIRNGVNVGCYESYGANHFESLVHQVRMATEAPVDWHYAGGRAVVYTYREHVPAVQEALGHIVEPALEEKREAFWKDFEERLSRRCTQT